MKGEASGGDVSATLARLTARLPALSSCGAGDDASLDRAARDLRALVTEAGAALRKYRSRPRSSTAPIESFRAGCRQALAALRLHARAMRRLESARHRLDRCRAGSERPAVENSHPRGGNTPS